MSTKCFISMLLLALFSSSCMTPKYLPSSENLDVDTHGSYIIINKPNNYSNFFKGRKSISGELISIENDSIFVLSNYSHNCELILKKDVRDFELLYAKPKNYGLVAPIFVLSTISHGFFLAITAPINIMSFIIVSKFEKKEFTYDNSNISYDRLKMFARYPQGIPANVNIADIK